MFFYKGKVNGVCNKAICTKTKDLGWPTGDCFAFVDVSSSEMNFVGSSYDNRLEAEQVILFLYHA